jgi:probable phosphoglycerate mutase
MRHGDVDYSAPRGVRVDPERVSLTEEGRAQARAAGRALEGTPLDRVLSSGLPRTRETAEIVVGDRGLAVEPREAFQEIRPGRLEGIPPGRIREMFLGAIDGAAPGDTFLLGETWGAFQERVLAAFEGLLAEGGWANLLLVAHGGVNRVLLLRALGLGLGALGRLEQDPCGLNVIDVDPDGSLQVRLVNATVHDPAKAGLRETTMERLVRSFERGGG